MPRTSATSAMALAARSRSRSQRVRAELARALAAAARPRSRRASRAPPRSRPSSSRACSGRARGRRRRRDRGARSARPSGTPRRRGPCRARPCRERCRSARTRTSRPVRPRQIGTSSRIRSAPWRSQASRRMPVVVAAAGSARRCSGPSRRSPRRRPPPCRARSRRTRRSARCTLPPQPKRHAARIAGRHVLGARQQRADVAAEHRFAADRDRVERGAVEAVPHRDRLVPAGGDARELERHADRERAAGREQHLAERVGRERDELLARARRPRALVKRRGENGSVSSCALDRGDHARMAGSRPGARCCRGSP